MSLLLPYTAVMAGEGYDGGFTRGGRLGCSVAAIAGTALFAFLLLADSLGEIAIRAPTVTKGSCFTFCCPAC